MPFAVIACLVFAFHCLDVFNVSDGNETSRQKQRPPAAAPAKRAETPRPSLTAQAPRIAGSAASPAAAPAVAAAAAPNAESARSGPSGVPEVPAAPMQSESAALARGTSNGGTAAAESIASEPDAAAEESAVQDVLAEVQATGATESGIALSEDEITSEEGAQALQQYAAAQGTADEARQ
jgi:hypothetical protein